MFNLRADSLACILFGMRIIGDMKKGIAHFPKVQKSPHKTVSEQELRQFFTAIGSRVKPAELETGWLGQNKLEQFFTGIGSRMESAPTPSAHSPSVPQVNHSDLQKFFVAATLQVEQQRRLDQRQASRFNVFDLIDPDENKLSDVIAGLLDPDGDHGQGDKFLRLLFKQLGLGSNARLTKNATVQREAPTHGIQKYRRRMDVFVDAEMLLAIENKVDSSEQPEQVKDYLQHLRFCTKGNGKGSVLIYLSPDGRRPESLDPPAFDAVNTDGQLRCWNYHIEFREWLTACHRDCHAEKIRGFLSDFIAYIETRLKRVSETNDEEENDEN